MGCTDPGRAGGPADLDGQVADGQQGQPAGPGADGGGEGEHGGDRRGAGDRGGGGQWRGHRGHQSRPTDMSADVSGRVRTSRRRPAECGRRSSAWRMVGSGRRWRRRRRLWRPARRRSPARTGGSRCSSRRRARSVRCRAPAAGTPAGGVQGVAVIGAGSPFGAAPSRVPGQDPVGLDTDLRASSVRAVSSARIASSMPASALSTARRRAGPTCRERDWRSEGELADSPGALTEPAVHGTRSTTR